MEVSATVCVCVCCKSSYENIVDYNIPRGLCRLVSPRPYQSTRATHGAMRYRQNRWRVHAFAAFYKKKFFGHNLSSEISGTYLERQTRTMFCGVMPAVFNVCRDYTLPMSPQTIKSRLL